MLVKKGYECVNPLEGLSIDQQLQWLERATTAGDLFHNMRSFYSLLAKLRSIKGQFVELAELRSHDVPKRGVYFFFDPDERSRLTGLLPRLVRISTHAVSAHSKPTLWQRLRTHRGTVSTTGNHRSSVFRLHVGAALLARKASELSIWGKRQDAPRDVRQPEAAREKEVTQYLGRLLVAHIEVSDSAGPQSDRAYIELNAIALMSAGGSLDPPGANWLGANSPMTAIRENGLWNVNHVGERYEAECLNVLRHYVAVTRGVMPRPKQNIAPLGWRQRLSHGKERPVSDSTPMKIEKNRNPRSDECKDVLQRYSRAIAHMREQFANDRLGLVFGAGIGKSFNFPDWNMLLSRIASEIQGEEILECEKNLTAQAQQLYQRFKQQRSAAPVQADEENDKFLAEMKLRAEWRKLVHDCLYEDVPDSMEEILKRDTYLVSFLKIVRQSPLTVTYNFDNMLERLLAETRTEEEKKQMRGYTAIWSGNVQLPANTGVVYHPNGFLPHGLREKPSDDLVFLEDSFADQLIDSTAGRYASLSVTWLKPPVC